MILKCKLRVLDESSEDDGIMDADKKTKKYERANETAGYYVHNALKPQVQPSLKGDSTERSQNVSATFNLHIKQDRNYENRKDPGNSFPEALEKYNKVLKKIMDKMFPDNYRRETTHQRTSVLSKKDAEDLRQQFDQVRSIRSDKRETTQWKTVERCHDQLLSSACREIENNCIKKILDGIEDILRQMAPIGSLYRNYKLISGGSYKLISGGS